MAGPAAATAPVARILRGRRRDDDGAIAGIVAARPPAGVSSPVCPGPAIAAADAASPANPYNGDPPFTYHGGPMMGTTSAVTVTPIYWAPGGFGYSTNYQSLTGQFIGDAAHDSGLTTDVFSVLEQYTDAGSNHFLNDLSAGAAITDTDAYPASGGCTADTGKVYADGTGYSACVTDAEIQAELSTVLSAHGLPTGLGHLYVVFLAKGVESCITTANEAGGGDCTVSAASTGSNSFCSYHSAFGTTANPTIYDDIPYAVSDSPTSGFTCSSDAGSLAGGGLVGNQSPNGNLAADTSISLASHEMSEAFTDPEELGLVRRRRRPERDRRRLRLHLRRFVDLPWPGGRRIQRDDQRRPLLHPGGVQQQRLRREQGERMPPGRLLDGDVQRQRRHGEPWPPKRRARRRR